MLLTSIFFSRSDATDIVLQTSKCTRSRIPLGESSLAMLAKCAPSAYNILLDTKPKKTYDYLPQNRQWPMMQVSYPFMPQLASVVLVMHQGSNKFTLQPVQITFSNYYYLSCIWARFLRSDEDLLKLQIYYPS